MKFHESYGVDQAQNPVFSVSEFLEYVNLLVGRRQVTVEGEIASFNVSQGKWVFFDLKDPQGTVSCFTMLFRLDAQLADGMSVRVTGTPRVHQKSGRFSIFVDTVELNGEGALRKAFELTKAKLEKEGIFDPARKRPVPAIPERIGLICSRESAAFTDFMRIVNQRWGGLEIVLTHVHVQGEQAITEIVGAFEYFNAAEPAVDTIVLMRGGGSLEDLQAFNSEAVARAVFGSKTPVICGVGHERDESLADYAADIRAATPTHAATLAVPDARELLATLDARERALSRCMSYMIEWQHAAIDRASAHLTRIAQQFTEKPSVLLHRLERAGDNLLSRVRESSTAVAVAQSRAAKAAETIIAAHTSSLDGLTRSLGNLNPLTVVKRGYSIIRKDGRVIKSARAISPGDRFTAQLSDGEIGGVAETH